MSDWIKIEDEHPPLHQDIWLFYSGNYIEIGFAESKDVYYPYLGCWRADKETLELEPIGPGRLTHWMPIESPNPPK